MFATQMQHDDAGDDDDDSGADAAAADETNIIGKPLSVRKRRQHAVPVRYSPALTQTQTQTTAKGKSQTLQPATLWW